MESSILPYKKASCTKYVSGSAEHTSGLTAIPHQGRDMKLLVSLMFLDLKNTFRSISHDLIMDMLNYVKVPQQVIITTNAQDCYSQLEGYGTNRKPGNPLLSPIQQGVFQGDSVPHDLQTSDPSLMTQNSFSQVIQPSTSFGMRLPRAQWLVLGHTRGLLTRR